MFGKAIYCIIRVKLGIDNAEKGLEFTKMQYDRFDLTGHRVTIPSLDMNLLYWEHGIRNDQVHGDQHFHDYWQAEFIVDGSVTACFEDQNILLDKQKVLIIPPGIRHSFNYDRRITEYYSFKFNCESEKTFNRPLLFSDASNTAPMNHYIVEFMSSDRLDREQVSVHIQNALKTLLEIELLYDREIKNLSMADHIRNLVQLTDGYFPTVDEIAEKMSLSRPHLSKKLKEETGYSLKPFLDMERIKHAKTLLLLSDLSISEISFQLGFHDIWSFSKFFRRMTDLSPSNFRQNSH